MLAPTLVLLAYRQTLRLLADAATSASAAPSSGLLPSLSRS